MDELMADAKDEQSATAALRRESDREIARAQRALLRARRSLGWELFPSADGQRLAELEADLNNLPSDDFDDLADRVESAAAVADGALRMQERIIARRRRRSTWAVVGGSSTGGGGLGGGGGSFGGGGFGGGGGSFGRVRGAAALGGGGGSFGGGRSSGSF